VNVSIVRCSVVQSALTMVTTDWWTYNEKNFYLLSDDRHNLQ